MKRAVLAITLLILTVSGLPSQNSHAQDKQPATARPTKMKLETVAFRGNALEVKLDGKELLYARTIDGREAPVLRLTPTDAAWKKFRQELDAIDAWKWKEKYIEPNVVDGKHWNLVVEWDGRKIDSHGSNMFPAQFERYEAAVRELIGEKAK